MRKCPDPCLFSRSTCFVEKCKPQKVVAVRSASGNTQIVAALWKELRRGCYGKVPLKTDWVPVTAQRLNSAWKKVKG